ncbi:MAG: glutaredoxin family protein [Candidatus Diapherotrites archaeon]|nr:glutaredoxin family protein [Candidatus Diapherotrites archaeon]
MSITVYSTTWCPYCKMAKEFLSQHKIQFEDINLEKNPEKAREMVKKSGQQGVPVIDVNGKIIIGFNKPALKEALGLA